MSDIIDINTGMVIEGTETIKEAGERILEYVISVVIGDIEVAAVFTVRMILSPVRGVSL